MKLAQGFITQIYKNEQLMVAAGATARRFHGLVRSNETAAFIIDCLKCETTEAEIAAKLASVYEVDEATAARDVQTILEQLRGIGAIE